MIGVIDHCGGDLNGTHTIVECGGQAVTQVSGKDMYAIHIALTTVAGATGGGNLVGVGQAATCCTYTSSYIRRTGVSVMPPHVFRSRTHQNDATGVNHFALRVDLTIASHCQRGVIGSTLGPGHLVTLGVGTPLVGISTSIGTVPLHRARGDLYLHQAVIDHVYLDDHAIGSAVARTQLPVNVRDQG